MSKKYVSGGVDQKPKPKPEPFWTVGERPSVARGSSVGRFDYIGEGTGWTLALFGFGTMCRHRHASGRKES